MALVELSLASFAGEAFSKAPAPGGGGVSAAAGALGAALGGMVTSLTSGKKKYQEFESDIQRIQKELNAIMGALLDMVDKDAEDFIPVAQAYSLKGDTPEEKENNTQILQNAMKAASAAPCTIVRESYKAVPLLEELVEKGSSLAISDVGCAAALIRSAISAAWLNVLININNITDNSFTAPIRDELSGLVSDGEARCDAIFKKVEQKITKQ